MSKFGTKRATVENELGPPLAVTSRGTVPISRACIEYLADPKSFPPPDYTVSLCFDKSGRLVERGVPSGNEN